MISVLARGDYTFKTFHRTKLMRSAILNAFPVASSQAGLTRSEVYKRQRLDQFNLLSISPFVSLTPFVRFLFNVSGRERQSSMKRC